MTEPAIRPLWDAASLQESITKPLAAALRCQPGSQLPPPVGYQHAIYYCSQDVIDASCAISLNGGLTYGPAVPIYTLADCGGLHGHIKVGPDGTAYVPIKIAAAEMPPGLLRK